VLAEMTAAMRDAAVSIESLIQKGRDAEGGEVLVAMVTHEGPERCVAEALALLEGSPSLTAPPLVMPILAEGRRRSWAARLVAQLPGAATESRRRAERGRGRPGRHPSPAGPRGSP